MEVDFGDFIRNVEKDANNHLLKIVGAIKAKIEPLALAIFTNEMTSSEIYNSLLDGVLEGEFGLVDPEGMVNTVITAIVGSAKFDLVAQGNQITFEIGISRSDFSDALSAGGASYRSTNKHGTTPLVDWLSWLLFDGSDQIIQGYEIMYLSNKRVVGSPSRTGKALMVHRDYTSTFGKSYNRAHGRTGPGSWGVPEQFAGTREHNWLTQIADKAAPKIFALLEKELV